MLLAKVPVALANSEMNPTFALVDLSQEEPDICALSGNIFTIGFKSDCNIVLDRCDDLSNWNDLKLTLRKETSTSRWRVSLAHGVVQKEAMLFIDDIYQSKKQAVSGVILRDGSCVDVYAKNYFVVRGIFFESSCHQKCLLPHPKEATLARVGQMDWLDALKFLCRACTSLTEFKRTGLNLQILHLPLPRAAATCDWTGLCAAVAKDIRELVIKIDLPAHAKNPVEQLRRHQWMKLERLRISYGYVHEDISATRKAVQEVVSDAIKRKFIDSRNLVSLDLEGLEIDLADFDGIDFPKLTYLRARRVNGFKNEPDRVRRFFLQMPRLEELEMTLINMGAMGHREEEARFFREAPNRWGLRKLNVNIFSNTLPHDFNEAIDAGKLANVTELHLAGTACKIKVPFPQVKKISMTAMDVEEVPDDVSEFFPAATEITLHAIHDILAENFTWRRRGFCDTDIAWFKRLKSVDVYPATGFPFHRVTEAQWIVTNDEEAWCRKDDEKKSGRFFKTVRRLRTLKKLKGFLLYNAIAPELTFLSEVEWDLEYLGLTSRLTPELLDRVVVRFPRLKFLQVGYCGRTFWDSVSKLRHLVCLIVGRRHPDDILPCYADGVLLPMPSADGFEVFMEKKPDSLRYVEFYGYRLYCPGEVADFKYYLGPDADRVVRAEEHRAMLDI